MLHPMDRRTVTITLHVEVDGDDVRGRAEAAGAAAAGSQAWAEAAPASRPFAGWLGLVGAIDALLGFPPDQGAAARALATQEGAPR
jgi:hypothetical protein